MRLPIARSCPFAGVLPGVPAVAMAAPRASSVGAAVVVRDGTPVLGAAVVRGALCVRVTARSSDAIRSTCGDPTTRDDRAALLVSDGVAVSGAVPAQAATVRLVGTTGRTVDTPAVPDPRATGPLAGRVAFFSASSAPDVVAEVRALRADGTLLGLAPARTRRSAPAGRRVACSRPGAGAGCPCRSRRPRRSPRVRHSSTATWR